MWLNNRSREEQITLLNESHSRGTGGLLQTEQEESVNIYALWIPQQQRYEVLDKGTFIREVVKVQITADELAKVNFTIIPGKTIIKRNGENYRVSNILEFPTDNEDYLQLSEFTVYRKYKAKNAELV